MQLKNAIHNLTILNFNYLVKICSVNCPGKPMCFLSVFKFASHLTALQRLNCSVRPKSQLRSGDIVSHDISTRSPKEIWTAAAYAMFLSTSSRKLRISHHFVNQLIAAVSIFRETLLSLLKISFTFCKYLQRQQSTNPIAAFASLLATAGVNGLRTIRRYQMAP